MRSPRLQQIRNIIERSGGGLIKADYLPGSWMVEVQWGELIECEEGEIEAEGFPRMKYPNDVQGMGKTFTAAVKDAFEKIA